MKAEDTAEAIIAEIEKAIIERQGDELRTCPVCGQEFDLVEIDAEMPTPKEIIDKLGGREKLKAFITENIAAVALAAKPLPPAAMPSDEVGRRLRELEPVTDAIREITNAMVSFKKACSITKDPQVIEELKTKVLTNIDNAMNKLFRAQQ